MGQDEHFFGKTNYQASLEFPGVWRIRTDPGGASYRVEKNAFGGMRGFMKVPEKKKKKLNFSTEGKTPFTSGAISKKRDPNFLGGV